MQRISVGSAYTLVDDEDYPFLNRFHWMINDGYPVVHMVVADRQHLMRMGRLILNPGRRLMVDHINGDPLDNRKANLRLCSIGQNNQNARPHGRNTASRYKGVHLNNGRWAAGIYHDGVNMYLGLHSSEEDAALAYDEKARILKGEYAWLNVEHFPELARYKAEAELDAQQPGPFGDETKPVNNERFCFNCYYDDTPDKGQPCHDCINRYNSYDQYEDWSRPKWRAKND